jgi:hypothetical protein
MAGYGDPGRGVLGADVGALEVPEFGNASLYGAQSIIAFLMCL